MIRDRFYSNGVVGHLWQGNCCRRFLIFAPCQRDSLLRPNRLAALGKLDLAAQHPVILESIVIAVPNHQLVGNTAAPFWNAARPAPATVLTDQHQPSPQPDRVPPRCPTAFEPSSMKDSRETPVLRQTYRSMSRPTPAEGRARPPPPANRRWCGRRAVRGWKLGPLHGERSDLASSAGHFPARLDEAWLRCPMGPCRRPAPTRCMRR